MYPSTSPKRRRKLAEQLESISKLTYTANKEWHAEPQSRLKHFPSMCHGDDGEEDGEYYGAWETGHVLPQIDKALVLLQSRHAQRGADIRY